MKLYEKKSLRLSALVITVMMIVTVWGGAPSVEVYAAENWIETEVESFNDSGTLNGGKEVLEEVSKVLGNDYGSRLYGTKLAVGGADYVERQLERYCDKADVAVAKTHYHPDNADHPRYPGTIYPENHRIHGVVEFGKNNTTSSVAVGRAIPAYDEKDYSEYTGSYLYPSPAPNMPGTSIPYWGPNVMKPIGADGKPEHISGTYFENDADAFTGEFFDFGILDSGDPGALNLPAPSNAGTNVYGTIRLAAPIDAADIAALENKIESVSNVNKLTGLYIASNIKPDLTGPYNNNPLNVTMNRSANHAYGVPYVMADTWKAETEVSAISMTLKELNKVVKAGKAGKIKDSYRVWPDKDYSAYGIIEAATDDPDLVLLISGHIDNVTAGYGVVDDGGAIATEVEIARRLSTLPDGWNGNVEIIFAAVGGEEHSDFNGMYWIVDNLIKNRPGILQKTINLNMDQVSAANDPDWAGNSRLGLNVAYGFDESWHRGISLPLHLVVKNWVEFGKFDSQPDDFLTSHDSPREAFPGNDNAVAGAEYIENFSINHGGNRFYHSSLDAMSDENYSLERHQYSTNLMHAAILRAVKDDVSKRAEFDFLKSKDKITASLKDADTMFKTYDKVTVEVKGKKAASPVKLEFTPKDNSEVLPIDDYSVVTETKSYEDKSGVDKSGHAIVGDKYGGKRGNERVFEFDKAVGHLSIDENHPNLGSGPDGVDYTIAKIDSADPDDERNPSNMTWDFNSKLVGKINNLVDISGATVGKIKNQAYTGKAKSPKPVVTLGGKKLTVNVDYKLKYSNNIKTGKANIQVSGINKYAGKKVVNFKIIPKKQSIVKSAVSNKKRQLTLKWKKDAQTTGYQVVIGTNQKVTKGKKTAVIKKNAIVRSTFKKLKTGKVYYAKIRAYKTIDGKKCYGDWSSPKRVGKIKK